MQRHCGKPQLVLSIQMKEDLSDWNIVCKGKSGRKQNQIGVKGIQYGRQLSVLCSMHCLMGRRIS